MLYAIESLRRGKPLTSRPCSRRMMKQISRTIDQFPYYASQENLLNRLLPPQLQLTFGNNLGHSDQWAYKKSHSTELLLVKMIEDWRRALDKDLVVGIVFIFRKAFDSVSHHVLLNRLQAIVIAGDLWCWIKDYLELLS